MNKKIETYEKIMSTVETIIAFERQTGIIKAMLHDKQEDNSFNSGAVTSSK